MPAVLHSPLDLWNVKVSAYERFAREAKVPTRLIRFERFVAKPKGEVKETLTEFGIPFGVINQVDTSTKNPDITLAELSNFYEHEGWSKHLTQEVVIAINALIDWNLVAKHGYYQLNPADFPSRFTLKSLSRNHNLMLRSGFR